MTTELNRFTQNLMAKFPSWMKMAKDPESVGAQFLDVFGLTLADFKDDLDEIVDNFYIGTAHTDVIDLLYKIPLATINIANWSYDIDSPNLLEDRIHSVVIEQHDGSVDYVNQSRTLRAFYRRDASVPRYFIDGNSGYLYLRVDFDRIDDWDKPFQSVRIDDNPHYDLELHHVWNIFDEFGLLLGLSRLRGERNDAYKARLLDVFENPGNATYSGMQNAIARELGIDKSDVKVSDFHDQAYGGDYINANGTPTEKLVRYAKELNDQLKFTWDHFNLGEAYWFSIEQDNLGIHYLPHIWDVDLSLFGRDEFQSGVGDVAAGGLLVTPPKTEDSARAFTAYVSLIGYIEHVEEFFPEIAFQYKIYAQGKVLENTYDEEAFRYTVDAAEVFDQPWRLVGYQDFPYTMRTTFEDRNRFVDNADRERTQFAESNTFLHTQTDQVFRLGMRLSTENTEVSNWLKDLQVIWEDTLGDEHTYAFNNEAHYFLPRTNASGEPETALGFTDMSYDETNGLGLGYGAFVKDIDTTAEWQQGTWERDNILIREGTVSLNLDRMAGLMN